MTVIQNSIQIDKNANEVFQFLADCRNHEKLMPSNVYNWSATEDEARFTIQNMAKLALKVEQRVPSSLVTFVPAEKAPFDVSMKWEVNSIDENTSEAKLTIEADLNMMLKMIASGPLQKLVDHQVQTLKEVLV